MGLKQMIAGQAGVRRPVWVGAAVAISIGILIGSLLALYRGTVTDKDLAVGGALLTGSILGLLAISLEQALVASERRRTVTAQKQAARESLRLHLGSSSRFSAIDLRGQDLSGFYLPRKDFQGANFEGSDLRGAILDRSNLDKAILVKADLAQASFVRSKCRRAGFANASLKEADFSHAYLARAVFVGAAIDAARFVDADLRRADFTGATGVDTADFEGADLTGARFDP